MITPNGIETRRCTNGDETDAYSPLRGTILGGNRPGVLSGIKRRTRRRERAERKAECRRAISDANR